MNGNLERAASSPKASGPTLAAGQALVLGLRPKEEDSIGLQSPRVSAGIVKHATLIQRGLEVTRGGQRQIHTGGSVQLEFTCIFFFPLPQKALILRKTEVCQVSGQKELPHIRALWPGSEVAVEKDSYIL